MWLDTIHVYPIKSTTGLAVPEAGVEPWGLAGDRRHMVVGPSGAMIGARRFPRLLSVEARPYGGGASGAGDGGELIVTGPHAEPLKLIPDPGRRLRKVRIWDSVVQVKDVGDEAAAWFSDLLGRPVRVVWMDDPARRPIVADPGHERERVSLADNYPVHLTSLTSLDELNARIAAGAARRRAGPPPAPLAMARFRPNVVIGGVAEPFAEDGWTRVRIGTASFRTARPCDRCVVAAVDPVTLEKGREPIHTLAKYRKRDGLVWFGTHLIPDGEGAITVGDQVTVE